MNAGGELTGRVARELAAERQRRLVELVDAEVIRRALSGCPSVLAGMTQVERELVIAIADMDGFNHRITAEGLGLSPRGLGDAITSQRRRVGGLTRDLQAAVMLRPAADLVAAVASGDADRVAAALSPLSLQQFAALAVVLAAAVSDPSILPDAGVEHGGIPTFDDAGV